MPHRSAPLAARGGVPPRLAALVWLAPLTAARRRRLMLRPAPAVRGDATAGVNYPLWRPAAPRAGLSLWLRGLRPVAIAYAVLSLVVPAVSQLWPASGLATSQFLGQACLLSLAFLLLGLPRVVIVAPVLLLAFWGRSGAAAVSVLGEVATPVQLPVLRRHPWAHLPRQVFTLVAHLAPASYLPAAPTWAPIRSHQRGPWVSGPHLTLAVRAGGVAAGRTADRWLAHIGNAAAATTFSRVLQTIWARHGAAVLTGSEAGATPRLLSCRPVATRLAQRRAAGIKAASAAQVRPRVLVQSRGPRLALRQRPSHASASLRYVQAPLVWVPAHPCWVGRRVQPHWWSWRAT